ncbi:MAG: DUF4091 domain-containing protein [Oscillospiraceae bacterium]|nr:DUF4091 domain-containing protein [Oscillospiraceae bacterium]
MSNLELRLLSSLAKVFTRNAPSAKLDSDWLSALMGERVSLQAAYLYEGDVRSWGKITVKSPDGVQVVMRRVRYMPGYIPGNFKTDGDYISSEDGVFPDLLEPFDANRLPLINGIWQSVWIDFHVTSDAKAGLHPIVISIETDDGVELATVETTIEVIPVELPSLEIPHTKWFHVDCLANYYEVEVFSEKHWEIIENFVSYAVEHGINTILTPIHTPPLDTEIGGERLTTQLIDVSIRGYKYDFDFTKLERWVEMCKRVGVKYFEIAHLFTQWGAKHAPKIMGTKDSKEMQFFGWETDATGPEYSNYLKQMLPALIGKLNEWGISENTIFHISDEPTSENLENYMAARKIVEEILSGFRVVDALSDYAFYEKGVVPLPIPAVSDIEPFIEANVPELWCYFCCSQSSGVPNHFFMHPSYRNRILGVLMYKFNIKGFLHWGYNFYNSVYSIYPVNPFHVTDADGAFPSGDSFLVYPGSDGKPLASLRLMVNQEAFNDYCALTLLEKLEGRELVLTLIDEILTEELRFSNIPTNDEYLIKFRRYVNKRIGASR